MKCKEFTLLTPTPINKHIINKVGNAMQEASQAPTLRAPLASLGVFYFVNMWNDIFSPHND